MPLDLDTCLVVWYTMVDDVQQAQVAPPLSDSAGRTWARWAQWVRRSERALGGQALEPGRAYGPRWLSHSAYKRRRRQLAGVLGHLGPRVAQALGAGLSPQQGLDTVPGPLLRRGRGQSHRLLADAAAMGRGGSDHVWYDGASG